MNKNKYLLEASDSEEIVNEQLEPSCNLLNHMYN